MKNIQVMLLNKDFETIAIIMDFSSLQWIEKYYDIGQFELHCGGNYFKVINNAKYVYRNDKENLGIIKNIVLDSLANTCTIKGIFVESILNERVLESITTYTGNNESIVRDIVSSICIENSVRKIPILQLGEYKSLGIEMNIQRSGKTVYDVVKEILLQQELWFKIKFDFLEKKLIFEVFQGLDRTHNQMLNSWCVFSSEFYNLLTEKYTREDDLKNYVYVAGKGKAEDRIIIEISAINDGEERRELYVDARDLQQDENMTDEEYRALLRDRGLLKLAEYMLSEGIELQDYEINSMEYGIGDKVTYENKELGIEAEGRVTEIYEVFELKGSSRYVKLGKDQLTIVQKIMREVN